MERLRGGGWQKRNRNNFYWVMFLMCTIWEYFNACYNSKIFVNSSIFFSFLILVQMYHNIYLKYLKQYVLISCVLLIFLNQNASVLFVNNIYIRNIRTVCHRKLYIKTWYSLKSLWILLILSVWFFEPKLFQYLHTSNEKISQGAKCFKAPHLYTTEFNP